MEEYIMPSAGGAKPPHVPVWAKSWDEVFGGRDKLVRQDASQRPWGRPSGIATTQGPTERPEAEERLAERLEGTEPLTDEEIRALLLMEPSGPLPENGHEARAVASARSKLRARLARADG